MVIWSPKHLGSFYSLIYDLSGAAINGEWEHTGCFVYKKSRREKFKCVFLYQGIRYAKTKLKLWQQDSQKNRRNEEATWMSSWVCSGYLTSPVGL